MADFTLTAFPPGTDVEIYLRSDFPAVPGMPKGDPGSRTPVDTGTVDSDGSLVIEGLDPLTVYVAYAELDGEDCYVWFMTGDEELDSPVVILDGNGDPVTGKRLVVHLDGGGDVDSFEVEDA